MRENEELRIENGEWRIENGELDAHALEKIRKVLTEDGKAPDRLPLQRRAVVLGTEFEARRSRVRHLFQLMTRHYVASSIAAVVALVFIIAGMLIIMGFWYVFVR